MIHIAISIEILSYSLSIIAIALMLVLWSQTREASLLGVVGMTALFTALLAGEFLIRYTGNKGFTLMNSVVSALMVYMVPQFTTALMNVKFWSRPYSRLLLVWVGLIIIGLVVNTISGSMRFIHRITFISLGCSIAISTTGAIIFMRTVGRLRVNDYPWYARTSLRMAYLALVFLPGFVVFDFPNNIVWNSTVKDVVEIFSVTTFYHLIWNIGLLKGTISALAQPKISGSEENLAVWMDGFLLSPREAEVCRLLIQGATYGQIEERLFISRSTVKTHTNHIYQKTGTKNQVDLMKKASGLS